MLKSIEESELDKMIAERREWNSYTGGTGIKVLEEVKSKLVDLPDSSDKDQDELWNEVRKITANYGLNIITDKMIEELKSKFTITKK